MIMSPMLLGFFPLTTFIPVVMTVELLGGLWLSRSWELNSADRSRLYRLLIVASIGLPIGALIGLNAQVIYLKLAASTIVLVFSIYLLLQAHVRIALSWITDSLAGILSGVMLGSCGIGGPIVALYFSASNLEFKRARALLSLATSGLALLAIIGISLINTSLDWLPLLPVAAAAYFSGFIIAHHIEKAERISHARIQKICLYLLAANSLLIIAISLWT